MHVDIGWMQRMIGSPFLHDGDSHAQQILTPSTVALAQVEVSEMLIRPGCFQPHNWVSGLLLKEPLKELQHVVNQGLSDAGYL
jgi:hypothetical protein